MGKSKAGAKTDTVKSDAAAGGVENTNVETQTGQDALTGAPAVTAATEPSATAPETAADPVAAADTAAADSQQADPAPAAAETPAPKNEALGLSVPAEAKNPEAVNKAVPKPVTLLRAGQQSAAAAEPVMAAPDLSKVLAATDASGRRAISHITDVYAIKMKPGLPIDAERGQKEQVALYRALINFINNSEENFEQTLEGVLSLFRYHAKGVFHATRRCRFAAEMELGSGEVKTFHAILDVFDLTADPRTRALNLKQIDLIKAFGGEGVTARGRDKILAFYGQ